MNIANFLKEQLFYRAPSVAVSHSLNPIQDGLFRGCSKMAGEGGREVPKRPPPKTFHTYPTMKKLSTLPKEDLRNMSII